MNNQTKYLKLNCPTSGALNWGEAINTNMRVIDSAYRSLDSRTAAITAEYNRLGYISIDSNVHFVKIIENGLYIGGDFQEVLDAIEPNYTSENYLSLDDYTGWYVIEDYNTTSIEQSIGDPTTENWEKGEILVKLSDIDNITNTRIAIFKHFPQALGGFYEPEQDSSDPTIVHFIKKLPEEAINATQIELPLTKTQNQTTFIGFNSFNWTQEGDRIKGTLYKDWTDNSLIKGDIPPVQIQFFERKEDVEKDNWEQIFIEYGFQWNFTDLRLELFIYLDGVTLEEVATDSLAVGITVGEKINA